MDAPKGRYSVLEKDGRLVVVDNDTGAPITRSSLPPRGVPGAPPAVVAPVGSALDRATAIAVRLVASGWDGEGRAVIGWEWQENGRTRRWDARLDAAGQRRLGRALLAIVAAPSLFLLVLLLAGIGAIPFAAVVAAPFAMRGFRALKRLRAETGGAG